MDDHTLEPIAQPSPPAPSRIAGLSRRAATALTATGLLVGGMAGGFIVSHAATSTPSPSASSSPGSSTAAPPTGMFRPNEDPTHEAGESAQREAQENAGQVPTVP